MMKYFYVSTFRNCIDEVEVVGETVFFVKLQNGRREAKTSEWFCYRKTRKEVKQWLVNLRQAEVDQATNQLNRANRKLEEAQAL